MTALDPAALAAALRVTTPVLLAALAVLVSDRAGVMNIGVEGIMLLAAFAGVVGSAFGGGPWVGLLAALLTGAAAGGLLAAAVLGLAADLILAGIALNLAAASGTVLLLFLVTGDKGLSVSLQSGALPVLPVGPLARVPLLGPLLAGQHVLTWAAFAAVPVVAFTLRRTVFGLRLRAVGEDPESARAAGVSVVRVRAAALVLSGVLAGAGGAFLSLGYVTWFAANMTAGRGFVGLAAEVMGNGAPLGALLSSLLLGGAEAAATHLQGRGLPFELVQAAPYAVGLLALALHGRRRGRRARAAGGRAPG